MSMTLENKEYVKRGRDRVKAQGGKQVNAMLTPEEAAALAKLQEKLGLGVRDTIGTALLKAAKHVR